MATNISSLAARFTGYSKRKKIFIIVLTVLVLLFVLYKIFHKSASAYTFVPVTRGTIAETVSVTGNTTPISSVSLGFASSGTIARINSSVGKTVTSGQVLAVLNAGDLYAQLAEAEATLHSEEANYQKVVSGATGPDIDVAQAAVHTAEVNLSEGTSQQAVLVANAHRTLLNSSLAAKATTGTTAAVPTISGTYTKDVEGTITITAYPSGDGGYFTISGLASGTGQISSTQSKSIGDTGLSIIFPAGVTAGGPWTIAIPNTEAANYLANYNAYQSAQQSQAQTLASLQAALDQAKANLALKVTAARPEDVAAAQAQVDSARAGVASISARLANFQLVAPISGVITEFDAKVGQYASPGTTLVSIISANSFEIDALVSETDVGKIVQGDTVSMTLDAFPGETFPGTVFYIDPAQTSSGGVVGYKIKIAFDQSDPRMKSGLTANLTVNTRHKDDVLILPQYAILQNDSGTFVEVLENKKVKDIPVTLGLQDQKGNVEITSGVTEGEEVLNIGLKQ